MSLFIIMEFSLCQEPVFSTIVSYLMTRAASYACLYRAPTPPHAHHRARGQQRMRAMYMLVNW